MKRYRELVITGTQSDQFARTPSWLLSKLSSLFGITFDACPTNPTADGLKIPWQKNTYCNPPYRRIGPWLKKADREWLTNHICTIFLIPVRFYAKYAQSSLANVTAVYFATDLIQFRDYKAPLGIGLCVWVHGNPGRHTPALQYRIGVIDIPKPYSYTQATPIFTESNIPFVIVKENATEIVSKEYMAWKKNPTSTRGILLPAQTKLRVFQDLILPEASYIGFCNHLLKEKPGSQEFCLGSVAVIFGPGGHACYQSKHNLHTIPAGFINTRDPQKKPRKRRKNRFLE